MTTPGTPEWDAECAGLGCHDTSADQLGARLGRRCQCRHPYGDHSLAPPYACLTLRMPPRGGGSGCDCAGYQESPT